MSKKSPSRASYTEKQDETTDGYPFSADIGDQRELRPTGLSAPITKNATYLGLDNTESREWDISGWPSRWKRLELLNRGIYNGKWENQTRKRNQDEWYLCQNIACQLELSGGTRKRLWRIFRPLDMRSFKKYERGRKSSYTIRPLRGNASQPTIAPVHKSFRKRYLVIFAICALLHNQMESDRQVDYYPGEEADRQPHYGMQGRRARNLVDGELYDRHELLQQFSEELEFRDEDIRSCMEKLRQEVPQLRE